ncbi:sensor histidine kinase [Paraburkholderia sp. ZP32-5]|uniref:sensor histidine kinase n=1 Tax=Paraburkholderia sp. ZP32-5 TaxID=2883245 RepID=UPI001F4658A2|nr:ATP-binding protein [Paraburkholderia sp. ZP32-5]
MQLARRDYRVRVGAIGWLLVFVISSVALFALLYWLTSTYLLREVDERLKGKLSEFHAIDRDQAISNIDELSRRDIASTRPYGVFDASGTWLAGNVHRLPHEQDRVPFSYTQTVDDGGAPSTAHFRGIIIPAANGLRIVVGHSIDGVLRFDQTLVQALCAGVTLSILLAVACGAMLNSLSNRRIRAVGETAREIMAGKLGQRLPTRGTNDDLDRLSVIVNTMLNEIEHLVDEVRCVCAGVAHDLRTPMTHLRAGLERASRRTSSTADYARAIDDAINQSDAVLARFSALLRIAEIESGSRRSSFRTMSLDTVLRDVVELYEPLAEQRGISLTLNASAPVQIAGDYDLLFGAIENLLDNALKFTPYGGAVTADVYMNGTQAVLRIADNGPGIADVEHRAVLRPFYRGDTDATRSTPGHGLGLSLVAAIAQVHDASLEIHDNAPGCRMMLLFPAQTGLAGTVAAVAVQ